MIRGVATALVLALAGATLAVAPAGAGDATVIRVPADESTIQDAVDASSPGTLILVSPGVYREAVVVKRGHERIVIRGLDRSTTIVDGKFSDRPNHQNGFDVRADGVAIENLTVRNFATNGFLWTGVDGYRGSYISAIRNGAYGIFAFDSVHGQFDHAYAAGSADGGFYIGQCRPCDALIVDSEAEWNGLGYSGTNAGGNLVLARSSWHDNRVGIVPNSLTSEELSPQRRATIVGNHVHDNDNEQSAAVELAELAIGNGIVVAGGRDDVVERNLVTGHPIAGIAVIPLPETLLADEGDQGGGSYGGDDGGTLRDFDARDNTVRGNVSTGNLYDLAAIASVDDETDGGDNCFADNVYATSSPLDIEAVLPCDAPASGYRAEIAVFAAQLLGGDRPPAIGYREVQLPDPPALASMPRARSARARPATAEPSITIDVDSLTVPTAG